jgi:hypothetical protein
MILAVIGTIIVGMGVFRYQQMAILARSASRWASVRGWQYQHDLNPYGQPGYPMAATAQDVRDYVASQAVLLNTVPDALDVQVSWNPDNKQTHALLDANGTPVVDGSGNVIAVTNLVTVTVAYKWMPELFFAGPISLSSTSTVPMSY